MSDDGWTVHIDGAARGNPGPAAIAFVIARPGRPAVEQAATLGRATNNVAEYTALIRALETAAELGGRRLTVFSDSELLVKQMNGEYRVKNEELKALYAGAQALARRFDDVTLRHVRREQNSRADALCNQALDGQKAAAKPAAKRDAGPGPGRDDALRAEALACLQSAAAAWARGNAADPPPELVWDQLWSLVVEAGVLRKK
ncbi:MAG: ribonuclease HI family protein [Gemmataceae bacterium]